MNNRPAWIYRWFLIFDPSETAGLFRMDRWKKRNDMKIEEIGKYLESVSPLAYQEDYDNCGFLAGDASQEFSRALLCLDLTEKVMEEAAQKQCNLVISHHPFIFRGLKKVTPGKPETAILKRSFLDNITVYAMHTNLDNTLSGLNARVLSMLGAGNFRVLSPRQGMLLKLATFCPPDYAPSVREAMFAAGAGQIGNYDACSYNLQGEGTFRASDQANPFVGKKNELHFEKEIRIEVVLPAPLERRVTSALLKSHPYEEVAYDLYPLKNAHPLSGAGLIGDLEQPAEPLQFLARLKEVLNIPLIRHSAYSGRQIRKVAICTGSGAFLIGTARAGGADAFLTADIKYHDFFDAGDKMLLADVGHYESEQWVKGWLHDTLIEKFPTFAFLISEVNTNPVHYF